MSEVLAQLKKLGGSGGNIDLSAYTVVEVAGGSGQGQKSFTTQVDDLVVIWGGASGSLIGTVTYNSGLDVGASTTQFIIGFATGTTVTFTTNYGYGGYHAILRKS